MENGLLIERFKSFLMHEQNRSPHTVREYMHDVAEFATYITGGKPELFEAQSVTTTDIRSWLATQAKHIGPRSMRRKLQSLRALFRYMMKREGLAANPAAEIQPAKMPQKLPKFIKADDLEEVIANHRTDMPEWMEMRNNLIIDILYSCGLRRAELVAINDNDINFSLAELKVTGKGNKTRIIPLPKELLEKIRIWQNIRNSKWGNDINDRDRPLFRTARGRIAHATIQQVTRKMLAGIRGNATNPHSLRHSFATAMLDGGADINSVKEFLGHTSIATTQIYTHVSFEQMRKAYTSAHPRARKTDSGETE